MEVDGKVVFVVARRVSWAGVFVEGVLVVGGKEFVEPRFGRGDV